MKIPILKIPFTDNDLQFISDNVREILKSGHHTMGKYTERFEENLALFSKVKCSIASSSATSAMEIIIRALGIEGKTIIVPNNTFFATAHSVIHSGNRVVFLGSDHSAMCSDAKT